jgi:hypothetical protein
VAWLAGGFVFLGYMTHLVLDEIYSVDVMGRRIKSSFGTALKIFDRRKPGESALVAGLAILAFLATPPSAPFVEGITSQRLWAGLQNRLLPKEHWFGIDLEAQRTRLSWGRSDTTGASGVSDVTTGSVRKGGE